MRAPVWRSALAVLVGAALLVVLNLTLPPTGVWYSEVSGPRGSVVENDEFAITVSDAALSNKVQSSNRIMTTEAVFVAVRWEVSVKQEVTSFNDVTLRTADGLSYQRIYEFSAYGPALTAPGFTQGGVSIFELPLDAVLGAELVVGPDRGSLQYYGEKLVITDVVTGQTPHHNAIGLRESNTWVTP